EQRRSYGGAFTTPLWDRRGRGYALPKGQQPIPREMTKEEQSEVSIFHQHQQKLQRAFSMQPSLWSDAEMAGQVQPGRNQPFYVSSPTKPFATGEAFPLRPEYLALPLAGGSHGTLGIPMGFLQPPGLSDEQQSVTSLLARSRAVQSSSNLHRRSGAQEEAVVQTPPEPLQATFHGNFPPQDHDIPEDVLNLLNGGEGQGPPLPPKPVMAAPSPEEEPSPPARVTSVPQKRIKGRPLVLSYQQYKEYAHHRFLRQWRSIPVRDPFYPLALQIKEGNEAYQRALAEEERDRLLPPRRLPEAFTDTSWMQKPEPEPAIMTEKWRSPYDAGFWWQQSGQQNTTTQIQARLNQQSETSSIPLEEKDSPLNKVPAPPIEEEGKVASRSHSEISGGGNNVPPPPSLSAPEPEDEPGDQGIPEDVLHLLSSGKSSSQATTSKRAKPPKGFLIASPQSAGGLPDDDAFLPPVSLQDKQADIASWIEKGRPGHAQWKTPSSEQLGVYQSQAQNIAVKGGAGAGKTSTIMNKLDHLATRGQITQRNMHLFSYMHSGVDVLNGGRQDINALLPEHNPDFQIPEGMTYFALGHKILTKG